MFSMGNEAKIGETPGTPNGGGAKGAEAQKAEVGEKELWELCIALLQFLASRLKDKRRLAEVVEGVVQHSQEQASVSQEAVDSFIYRRSKE